MDIKSFIEKTGPEQSAKILSVSVSAVKHYRNGIRRVKPNKVIETCSATGWAVTPHELRPDVYPNPTDGLPAEKAADLTASESIKTIVSPRYTQFSGSGSLYSSAEQERRANERRDQERRDLERRERERRNQERRDGERRHEG